MASLLLVPQGGQLFNDISLFLKPLLADKASDVRKSCFSLLQQCLQVFFLKSKLGNGFAYPDLKECESKLVQYLLSGLDDENEAVRKTTLAQLSSCGTSIRDLDQKIGKDSE
jgi:hypothetical protein